MVQALKNDKQWDICPIWINSLDNCDKLSRIVLPKTRILAAIADYAISRFITADKKLFFVHVVYILRIDIVLDNVIPGVNKVLTKQLRFPCYLSLFVDTYNQLLSKFQISV